MNLKGDLPISALLSESRERLRELEWPAITQLVSVKLRWVDLVRGFLELLATPKT